jgi:hypothetical protein
MKNLAQMMQRVFQIKKGDILTKGDLYIMNQATDQILSEYDTLNPDSFDDSQKLDEYDYFLDYCEESLTDSLKKARIRESGLKLVVNNS